MKVATIYFNVPGAREPVPSGIVVVGEDDANFDSVAECARHVSGYMTNKGLGFESAQMAVAGALKASGYKVTITIERIVVDL